ncbi:MAG: hypothetical protein WC531_02805 [Candidatus Paceibacterota bacterium]
MLILSTNKLVKSLTLFWVSGLLLLFVFYPLISHAAFTKQINYQGKLTDATGTAVADGSYDIQFKLYTVLTGGSAIWTEDQTVTVTNGLFSVMLGSVTSLADTNFNQALYLGINVEADGEMFPRKILGSVPSSFTSLRLDGAASSTAMDISEYLIVNGNSTTTGYSSLATTSMFFGSKIGDTAGNYLTVEDYAPLSGTYVPSAGTFPLISFSSPNFLIDPTASAGGFKDNFLVFQDSVSVNPYIKFVSKDFSDTINIANLSYATTTHTFSFARATDASFVAPVNLSVENDLAVGGWLTVSRVTNSLLSSDSSGLIMATTTINLNSLTVGGDTPIVVGGTELELPEVGASLSIDEKIVGNYLYMVFQSPTSTDQFRIIDISNAYHPKVIGGGSLDFGSGGGVSYGARAIDVVGKYAYITFENGTFPDNKNFRIVDISDPTHPAIVGGSDLAVGSFSTRAVKVVGKYAYLGDYATGSDFGLVIVDISNPYNPKLTSPTTIAGLTGETRSLDVAGKYAYLVSYRQFADATTNVLRIVDVSDPTNPVVVGGAGISLPLYARKIQVVGRYAYITFDSFGSTYGIDNGLLPTEAFRIVDISDPTNPVVVGGDNLSFSCSLAGGGGIHDIYIVNSLAYITEGSSLRVLDVASSTNPTILRTFILPAAGGWPIVVSGNYAYIGVPSEEGTDILRILDLRGLKTGTANIGSLKIGSLNAEYDLVTAGNLFANGLNIGVGGMITDGNLSVNSTTTPSYFGGQVGIGTTTPMSGYSLAVSGDMIVTGTSTLASTTMSGDFIVSSVGTSTMAGNLDVAGNIKGGNVYTGDLYFANGWIITEAEKLGRDYSGLVFFDSAGNEVIALNADGQFIGASIPTQQNTQIITSVASGWSIGEDGLLRVSSLEITDSLKIGSPEKRIGFTLYDEVTGEPYCISLSNGLIKNTKGECGLAATATTTTPSGSPSDPSSTPLPAETATSTPSESPTPTSTDPVIPPPEPEEPIAPTPVEPTIEPEPIAPPIEEPAPTPEPTPSPEGN